MLAAHVRNAFLEVVSGSVEAFVMVADGLLQLHCSTDGRVLGEVLLNRANGRALDVVGSGKVGLTRAEIDHVDALAPQPVGVGGNLHRGGLADERNTVRQL